MNIDKAWIINDYINEKNNNQYMIPVYQRLYVWKDKQCRSLFNDIVASFVTRKDHFCGSIITFLMKQLDGINYYAVIDGQQRLTTVYILLKVLHDCADTDEERQILKKYIFNYDNRRSYDIEQRLKINTADREDKQLEYLLNDKFDKLDKSIGVWQNYELFTELVNCQKSKGLTVLDILKGIQNLLCGAIKLDSEDNAQEIFERINSTGVELTLGDKIRNFILMAEMNQEDLYKNYWKPMEQMVGANQLDDFLITYLNFKLDSFAKNVESYDLFKNLYTKDKYEKERMLRELVKYAKYYSRFINSDEYKKISKNSSDEDDKKIDLLLGDFQQLKQTTGFVFLFSVFDDLEINKVINKVDVQNILKFMINYGVRRIVCEVGSNSLRGLYKTLYERVFAKEENKQRYYDAIVSFLMQLSSKKDAFQTDEAFSSALKNKNLYNKTAVCKYLLLAIENGGKEKVVPNRLTIEHVMPQNKTLSTSWKNMLGSNWSEDREKWLHTIGNLTLTGYNSELGDRPFAEKVKKYLSPYPDKVEDDEIAEKEQEYLNQTKMVLLNKEMQEGTVWDKETIQKRADRLIRIVMKLYPTPQIENPISFETDAGAEYSCGSPFDAKSKKPTKYSIEGDEKQVKTYTDIQKGIIDYLYDKDPSIIESMARNNEKLEDFQRVVFSYDESIVNPNHRRIENTNIYVSYGFNATNIIRLISGLLRKYDIDTNDFSYWAK